MSNQTQSRCRRQRIRWRRRFGCEELEKNRNFCRKRATYLGEYLSPRDCVPCQTGQIFQYIFLVFVHSMVLAAKFCEDDREKKSIATEKAPGVYADIKGLWSVWLGGFSPYAVFSRMLPRAATTTVWPLDTLSKLLYAKGRARTLKVSPS